MKYIINIILLTSLANIVLARTTISLSYIPIRPFYAPYPIRYPESAIWPKIATELTAQVSTSTIFETTTKPNFPLDSLSNAVNEINKFVANLPKKFVPITETDVTLQKEPTELFTSPDTITTGQNNIETTSEPAQETILLVDDKVAVLNKAGIETEKEKNIMQSVVIPSSISEDISAVLNKNINDVTSTSAASSEYPVTSSKSNYPLDSLSSAINKINELVANLPDELLLINSTTQTGVSDQNKIDTTTTNLNQNLNLLPKETTVQSELPTTVHPVTNIPEVTNNKEKPTTTDTSFIALVDIRNKFPTKKTPSSQKLTTYANNPDAIIFPDEWSYYESQKPINTMQEIALVDKFGQVETSTIINKEVTTKIVENTPINLGYRPTRPFYAPDPIFYPQPSITSKPNDTITNILNTGTTTEEITLVDKFGDAETSTNINKETATTVNKNTPIVLGYRPTRPFYAPNPIFYPQPSVTSKPNDATTNIVYPSTTTQKIILVDKFGETTTKRPTTNTPIILGYIPIRPSYAPNPIFYPQPFITPKPSIATTDNEYPSTTTHDINLVDKFGEASTKMPPKPITQQVTPSVSLEYVPNLPSFIAGPIRYPEPSIPSEIPNRNQNNGTLFLSKKLTYVPLININ